MANALVGLHKLSYPDLGPHILKLSAHSDPLFRISGAWVMEQTSDPRFLPVLTEMIRDQNPDVRSRAFRAIGSIKRGTTQVDSRVETAECDPV
jgi:HEAT repeat protein